MRQNLDLSFLINDLQKRIFEEDSKLINRSINDRKDEMYSSLSSPNLNRKKMVLPRGYLTPIALKYDKIYKPEDLNSLRVGGRYFLYEKPCEGVEMPISLYECKHIIHNFGSVELNSVIMKQLEGEEDMIFSLTRDDCKNIGVEYEPKLQLFPINFSWKPYTAAKRAFNPLDMGTYEPSPKDGMIHQMHVSLRGIEEIWSGTIQIAEKTVIDIKTFFKDLRFRFKNHRLQRRFPITYQILTDKNGNVDYEEKSLNFMLFFGLPEGIKPEEFGGKNIDELIEVTWYHYEQRTPSIDQHYDPSNELFESCFLDEDGDWFFP